MPLPGCRLMPAALPCPWRPAVPCRCPLPSLTLPCFMGRSMQLTSPSCLCLVGSRRGARATALSRPSPSLLPSLLSLTVAATLLCFAPSFGGD